MKHFKTFENYNNYPENEPSKGLYIIEDLVETNFIKYITNKTNLVKGIDFEVLDVEADLFNKCYTFRILVYNVSEVFISELDNNYQEASKYYNEYVKSNGYKMPTIAFERDNALSFSMQS